MNASPQLLTQTRRFLALGLTVLATACTRCGGPKQADNAAPGGGATPATSAGATAEAKCIKSVVTAGGNICVLRTDSTVLCFGRTDFYTQTGPLGKVIEAPALKSIRGDADGFCGVSPAGEAFRWHVGDERAKLIPSLGTDNVEVITSGPDPCALKQNGELRCSQPNGGTVIGPGKIRPLPDKVLYRDVLQAFHIGVLTERGVELRGYNKTGVLGPGVPIDDTTRHPATVIPGLPGVVAELDGAVGALCALNQQGEVWCWGNGSWGGLGQGPERHPFCADLCPKNIQVTPVRVPLPEPARRLVSPSPFCALLSGGSIWCWGENYQGLVRFPPVVTHRIGKSVHFVEPTPRKNESFGDDNTNVFGDGENLCALKKDGSLWCAGTNRYSQIPSKPVNDKFPEQVPATRMTVRCD